MHPKLEAVIKNSKNIPTLPIMAANLLELMKSPDASAKDVTDLISRDQALASRVLRLANSAFYGVPQQVTTLSHAVSILGNYAIQQLALGVSMARRMGHHNLGPLNKKRFWQYAFGCGLCSTIITKRVSLPGAEEIFVAGLLHDIGYLIIGRHFETELARVIREFRAGAKSMSKLEAQVIGASHCQIGALLMKHWKLPTLFQVAAQYHDAPSAAPTLQEGRIAAVVALAEGIYPMQDVVLRLNQGKMVLLPTVLKTLHLKVEDCVKIRRDLEVEMKNLEEVF